MLEHLPTATAGGTRDEDDEMRVLLAETNWNAMTAAAGLGQEGLLVTRVNDGAEILDFAEFGEQNAVVFDLDVGDMDGLILLDKLRARHPLMPIYVLTKNEAWSHKADVYARGADVVISGNVDPAYLAAQIKAGVRRTFGYAQADLHVGTLVLHTDQIRATVDDQVLQLTRKEYEILEMMVLSRETLVTREAIMNHLYAWDDEPDGRIINVYLSRIRHQIEACGGNPDMLETVWGLGYRITANPVQAEVAA